MMKPQEDAPILVPCQIASSSTLQSPTIPIVAQLPLPDQLGTSPSLDLLTPLGSFANSNTFASDPPETLTVIGVPNSLHSSLPTSTVELLSQRPSSTSQSQNASDGNNPRTGNQAQPVAIHDSHSKALSTPGSIENPTSSNDANKVLQEYHVELDHIFFLSLNNICSNRKSMQASNIIGLFRRAYSGSDRC